ncbi:DUF4197 family protein [Frigoriflavimonas asaccharolytica]|uniref:DUF4197 family protein n=1 Tax=Frigoriflavimonas asaccharolytica TaxID=2735899 RepID=A0A8J8G9X3_9FLAO|nr:DUF4197 family protein [Frigoriflavimonas asaccharolytica]NRS91672.1 hypothetical protein [Frigoriflavimonas asaccharolytica]
MKKYIISAAIILSSGAFVLSTTQSCTALATSSVGISIIKNVLLGGINKATNIYGDKNAFLGNDLIEQAMPSQLREINTILAKISPSLLAKEKDFLAEAAAYTVNTSSPILQNAVNSLNADDVTRIMQGEKGMGTQILREKSYDALVAAIKPKVDEKLNQFGIVNSINTALQGSNLLGSLLGNSGTKSVASNDLSTLAAEQLVTGLFRIVQKHEVDNYDSIYKMIPTSK